MEEGDAILVRAAVGGDEAALQQLLVAHYDDLFRLIDRRLPAELRASTSAEDVLQATFCEVYQRIEQFELREPGGFKAWLKQVAINRMHDLRRAETAQKRGGGARVVPGRLDAESINTLLERVSVGPRTPSRNIARREAAEACQAAFSNLSDEYKEAIYLRYGQKLTCAQVAEKMNRTERAVQMLCHRGLRDLEQQLGTLSRFLSRIE